jgi:Icc-related predicted phosphoesterase
VRIAAVGDLHVSAETVNAVRGSFARVREQADVLLLAGDLTQHGLPEEARLLASELRGAGLPVAAVLGNHDYHSDAHERVRGELREAGAVVLEGESLTVTTAAGVRLSVAGAKGFGGGFQGACGTAFGEPEMKAFIQHTKRVAAQLEAALAALDGDVRVALLHYAPCEMTLMGERLEIYPFLGSYMLGEAIDCAACQLVVHGHAHRGVEHGVTRAGTPVRNVARPVIRAAYRVYEIAVSH